MIKDPRDLLAVGLGASQEPRPRPGTQLPNVEVEVALVPTPDWRSCAPWSVSAPETVARIIWQNVPPAPPAPPQRQLSGKRSWEEGGAPQPSGSLPQAPPQVTMTTGDSSPGSPVSFR